MQSHFKIEHRRSLLAGIAFLGGCLAAGAASAQAGLVDEVIVTAQKREQALQDVPMSLSVLGGEALDKSSVQTVNDALNRVPGVSVQQELGLSRVTVRGVTAGISRSSGASPIAYYLDTVPFGFVKTALAPDATAYDLDRVEVIKGPQGTLYGASALNGVMRVLTKDADVREFGFKARTSVSSTDSGGENYRGDLALNVPLVRDKLAVRAVVSHQDLSGWIDKPNDRNANSAKISDIRLKVRATPIDNLVVDGTLWFSRSEFGALNTSPDGGSNPSTLVEGVSPDYDIYAVRAAYDFPQFSITSATSYIDFLSTSAEDISSKLNVANTVLYGDLRSKSFSQEFVANSTNEGPWRWTLGAFYRDAEDDGAFFRRQYVELSRTIDKSESFAVFGELTSILFEGKLEVTGGLRYFEDSINQQELGNTTGTRPLTTSSAKFDRISPRVVVTYMPTDDLTAYASYSEGFRSGLLQSPTITRSAPAFVPAGPDTLTNYEVGLKGSVLNSTLGYELAAYYMDWEGIQQTLRVSINPPGGIFPGFVNGQSASGPGIDLQLNAPATERLNVGVAVSWNDLTFDGDVISGGIPIIPKGARPNGSSKWTIGANLDYAFPLGGSGYEGRLSTSANYRSRQTYTTITAGAVSMLRADHMLTARASFEVTAPENWSATLFVDNLSNENGVDAQTDAFPISRTRIRPRTVGVQFDYRY